MREPGLRIRCAVRTLSADERAERPMLPSTRMGTGAASETGSESQGRHGELHPFPHECLSKDRALMRLRSPSG